MKKALKKAKKDIPSLKEKFAALKQRIQVAEDESPVQQKVKMAKEGIFGKLSKVISGVVDFFKYIPIFQDCEWEQCVEFLQKLASSLDSISCLLTSMQKEVEGEKCEHTFYSDVLSTVYSQAQGIYKLLLTTTEQIMGKLPSYTPFLSSMVDLLTVLAVVIKQSQINTSEYEEADRRSLLEQLDVVIEDLHCCLPTIDRIISTLYMESGVTVSLPWKFSSSLSNCYIKRDIDIGGTFRDDILSHIELQPEQSFVSDIFIIDKTSKQFKLPKGETALIRFPCRVNGDPETQIFAVHLYSAETWRQVKAKYEGDSLIFEENEFDVFLAFSDFPAVTKTVTPKDGFCFKTSARAGLIVDIPPGVMAQAEEWQFKVVPVNRERMKECVNNKIEPECEKKSPNKVSDENEDANAHATSGTESSDLVSLSDGLVIHRSSNTPLQKPAKVTFPLEGEKEGTEVFLLRTSTNNNFDVYFEEELDIVNNEDNQCVVGLKDFSENHVGRMRKLSTRRSREDLRSDAVFILSKSFTCKIESYYVLSSNILHFRCECKDKRKRKLKRGQSKDKIKKVDRRWRPVPYYGESPSFRLRETGKIRIEVGGFFSCLQETHRDTMSITFISNANSSRVFPVQFTCSDAHGHGLLNFFGENGQCLHTVYFGNELIPPPPGDIPGPRQEDEGSVTSDRSFGVLTSFLSLPDTKQLVLQLGMTWNQIERVMESAGDPQIAKVQLLIEWRHRCGDRDDLAEQLIQGLRDIQNNLYASLVQRIHKRGSRLKPADMLDVCGR
ncbi:hypothetical protein ScPMuIL_016243 [Solemya velum]